MRPPCRAVYEEHRPDLVVNFAAESHNDRAILDPSGFMRTNALGAQVMVECSRQFPVRRHLHVSTIEVYGELPDDQPFFDERSALNAKTPQRRQGGRRPDRAGHMQTYLDMDICMTHCANDYGPYQLPEKLVPLMITNVLRGLKVPVYGDGLQKRDWLHVIDHCRAIQAILDADLPKVTTAAATDSSKLPIFDISARFGYQPDIVNRVLALLDADPDECIEHVADRPTTTGGTSSTRPRSRPTSGAGAPSVEFEAGLAETVQWYVDHDRWWKDILEAKGELQVDSAK